MSLVSKTIEHEQQMFVTRLNEALTVFSANTGLSISSASWTTQRVLNAD